VTLEADGVRTTYDVASTGDRVDVDWPARPRRLTAVPRFTDPADAVASGACWRRCPAPWSASRSRRRRGRRRAAVLVLEAMKMQHTP
jgi:propionyl-CoA carboxylase alpha chain